MALLPIKRMSRTYIGCPDCVFFASTVWLRTEKEHRTISAIKMKAFANHESRFVPLSLFYVN